MITTFTSGTIGHRGSTLTISRRDDNSLCFFPRLDWEDAELLGNLDELAEEHDLAQYSLPEALDTIDWLLSTLHEERLDRG